MPNRRRHIIAAGLALSFALQPGAARAQRAVDVQLGSWEVSGSNPTLYSAGIGRRLWGPLAYSLRGLALVDAGFADRSLYGLGPELSLFRGARALVPYAVGGVGLAVRPASSPEFAALWYAGLGLELNPLTWLGLALEAGYLAEDRGFQGFWDLRANDRQGWVTSARVSFRWGAGSSDPAGAGTTGPAAPGSGPHQPVALVPRPAEPAADAGNTLAGQIVETALAAMGEPYRWGGTSSDEGFDCSGLIWYAYTSHGVSVPRVSRDQARAGRGVATDIAELRPGDILLFAKGGDAVTHVGLYVGNSRFIHATTSGGVRVGALDGSGDGNDRWWRERWVGARRVLRE